MAEAIRRGVAYLRSRHLTLPAGLVLFHAQLPRDVVALAAQAFASTGENLVDQCWVETAGFGPAFHGNSINQEYLALDFRGHAVKFFR